VNWRVSTFVLRGNASYPIRLRCFTHDKEYRLDVEP
jgi:hypothetical protein